MSTPVSPAVPTADPDVIRSFLETLFQDAPGWLVIPYHKNGEWRGREAGILRDLPKLAAKAASHAQEFDVYVQCGLQARQPGRKSRGRAVHTRTIPGFWGDVDCRTGYRGREESTLPATKDEAGAFLDALLCPPTLIVDSGGGLQPWWLFKEPLTLETAEEWKAADRLSRAWWRYLLREARTARGWEFDSGIGVLNHVLRLPGTWNHKAHRQPLVWVDAGPRYVADDFELYADQDEEKRARAPKVTHQGKGLPDDIRELLAFIPCDDYQEWTQVGMALHLADPDAGFEIWNEWSAPSKKYPGREQLLYKWDGFDPNPVNPVTLGTCRMKARANGYKPSGNGKAARADDHMLPNLPGEEPEKDGHPLGRKISHIFMPRTVSEILADPEPEYPWIAEPIIPAGGNILIFGYPKSLKTFLHMELAVAAVTATPFLGKFPVGRKHRVGMVLMEGGERIQARRVERLALARGVSKNALDNSLFIWHRPPLTFTNQEAVDDLDHWVRHLGLDLITVDAWSYVAEGNSDRADEVTPQLNAFSNLRTLSPHLTTNLITHARKEVGDRSANRLTDLVRNSSQFGAWYDAGIFLNRKDEQSPVKVRVELRDHPAPEEFAFTAEDEEAASPDNGWTPQGYLRLEVSKHAPQTLDRMSEAQRLLSPVWDFIRENPGCSKNKIRMAVKGDSGAKDAAVDLLAELGQVRIEDRGKGLGTRITAVE